MIDYNQIHLLINNKIFIAIFSALFAVFFKHIYDTIKQRIDINKKRKALVDLLENVIVKNLNILKNNYLELIRIYPLDKFKRAEIPNIYYINSLDTNVLKFFTPTELISIFEKIKDAELSELYELIYDVDGLMANFSNEIIETNYHNRLDNIMNKAGTTIPKISVSMDMTNLKYEFINCLKEKDIVSENLIRRSKDLIKKLNHS